MSEVVQSLSDEVERLRRLVGPSERGFADLQADVTAAEKHARQADAAAGELRGRLAEMSVDLSRARQEQDIAMRRVDMSPSERWADRANRRWSASVRPRVQRLARRS